LERRVSARLTPAEGRKFAFPVGTAFLVLAGIVWWRGHVTVAMVFGAMGSLLLLAGLVIPGRLTGLYNAWMGFAFAISKVTTPIVMGITYFIVLAPIGLLMRLFGKNPIMRHPQDGSFWVPRPEGGKRKSDLQRQF